MPRSTGSLATVGICALAALALASCGGEDAQLLPGETAREITANLDTVQRLTDEGDCAGAESAAAQVGEQIEELQGVDRKLKQALEDGASRLNEVIAECEEAPAEAIAPAAVPEESEEEEEAPEEKKEKGKDEGEKQKEEPEAAETPPETLPPQVNGKGKGLENGNGPPEGEEEGSGEAPSGGVGPGSPATGEEE